MMYSYLAIEGIIGAGKTTLAKRFAEEKRASVLLERFEENAFLPKFYAEPDRYAFPLELSFLADRFQQMKDHFGAPNLFYPVTVADYSIFKSVVFAGATLGEAEVHLFRRMFSIVTASLPRPDLLVYLYLTPEQALRNIHSRGRDYEQGISIEYLARLQEGYLTFLRQASGWRIVIINTTKRDFVWRDADYRWISELMMREYRVGVEMIEG